MGDMDANGKKVTNLASISNLQSSVNLYAGNIDYKIFDDIVFNIADDGLYSNLNIEAPSFITSGVSGFVQASEFKFGSWSFKEVGGNLVIYDGGVAKATIQSTRTNSNL